MIGAIRKKEQLERQLHPEGAILHLEANMTVDEKLDKLAMRQEALIAAIHGDDAPAPHHRH